MVSYVCVSHHHNNKHLYFINPMETDIFFQQGDDPPFLPVGTDVSAKYKGAFCEAKIKKVVRNIKCKVGLDIKYVLFSTYILMIILVVFGTKDFIFLAKIISMDKIIVWIQDCLSYKLCYR